MSPSIWGLLSGPSKWGLLNGPSNWGLLNGPSKWGLLHESFYMGRSKWGLLNETFYDTPSAIALTLLAATSPDAAFYFIDTFATSIGQSVPL